MARSYPDEFCVCFRCFTGDRPTAATRASSYSYVWLRAFTIHTWATRCRCLCVTQIGKHWNAQLITVNADHEFCVADECRHRQNEHDEDIKHKSWPSVWQMAKAHPKRSWTFFFVLNIYSNKIIIFVVVWWEKLQMCRHAFRFVDLMGCHR